MMWLQRVVNNHFSKASSAVCSVVTRVGKHENAGTNGHEHSGVYLIMYITRAYCATSQCADTSVRTVTLRNVAITTMLLASSTRSISV
jgi:hypothetical protein